MIDRCSNVKWESADFRDDVRPALETFSLVWDPKMGEGHVLVAMQMFDPGCGIEPWPVWLCECGGWDWQDHHTFYNARDVA